MKDTISLICGRTKRIVVNIKNTDGEPYELVEGDEICLTVKQKLRDLNEVLMKKGTEITFDPNDTASLEPGEYVYDVSLKMSNGDVFTLIPHPSSGKSFADFILMKGVSE